MCGGGRRADRRAENSVCVAPPDAARHVRSSTPTPGRTRRTCTRHGSIRATTKPGRRGRVPARHADRAGVEAQRRRRRPEQLPDVCASRVVGDRLDAAVRDDRDRPTVVVSAADVGTAGEVGHLRARHAGEPAGQPAPVPLPDRVHDAGARAAGPVDRAHAAVDEGMRGLDEVGREGVQIGHVSSLAARSAPGMGDDHPCPGRVSGRDHPLQRRGVTITTGPAGRAAR